MFSGHESYCDKSHTMRQRCNDNLRHDAAQDAAALARFAIEPPARSANGHADDSPPPSSEPVALAEPSVAPVPDAAPLVAEEHAPSALQRDAVAAVEVPEATPYVTREWARTAAAVEGHESGGRYDLDPVSGGRDRSALRIAVIAWAIIAVVWLLLRLRSHGD